MRAKIQLPATLIGNVAICLASQAASAPGAASGDVWDGLRFGMSREQVRAVMPDAHGTVVLINGAGIPDFLTAPRTLGKCIVTGELAFANARLSIIGLVPVLTSEAALQACAYEIQDYMAAHVGEPSYSSSDQTGISKKWLMPSAVLFLSLSDFPILGQAILRVEFKPIGVSDPYGPTDFPGR